MKEVLIPILKLFFLLSAGFVARKTGIIHKDTTRGMSGLLVKITFPAMIFSSMQKPFTPELLREGLTALLISVCVYALFLAAAVLAGLLFRVPAKDKGVYRFALLFSNIGFMGFPILSSIFGEEVLFHASMFNIPFPLLTYTLGAWFLGRDGDASHPLHPKSLLSPGIIATVLGFICFIFSVPLPEPLSGGIKLLGDVTTPLSMLLIGSLLTEIPVRDLLTEWKIYLVSFLKLAVFPAVIMMSVFAVTDNPALRAVSVTLGSMPVAVNAPLMAHEYGGNEILATRLVVVSTFLSMITLPVVMLFLR